MEVLCPKVGYWIMSKATYSIIIIRIDIGDFRYLIDSQIVSGDIVSRELILEITKPHL